MDMAFYDRTILHSKYITELPKRFIATTLIHWLYPDSKSPNTEYIHYLDELSKFYIKIVTENDLDIIVLKQIEDFGDRIGDDLIYRVFSLMFRKHHSKSPEILIKTRA